MTTRQFYARFARALVRTPGVEVSSRGLIRLSVAPVTIEFCPITFLAYAEKEEHKYSSVYYPSEYRQAAGALGMRQADADRIAEAADSLRAEPQTRRALLRRIDTFRDRESRHDQ